MAGDVAGENVVLTGVVVSSKQNVTLLLPRSEVSPSHRRRLTVGACCRLPELQDPPRLTPESWLSKLTSELHVLVHDSDDARSLSDDVLLARP